MSIVRQIDELGAGAHLNGQAGVLIVADPGWFDAEDLKAAKPDLRLHLRTHPEAPCAERLREYLVDMTLDRFAVAHREAENPPAAPSTQEVEARDRLERMWIESRKDATAASEFPEAVARCKHAVLRAISNGAEIVASASDAELELADRLGDEGARREFLGAVKLVQRDVVAVKAPLPLLCRYFDVHDECGLSAIHFVIGAGRVGTVLRPHLPKPHRSITAMEHVSQGNDRGMQEVHEPMWSQDKFDFDDEVNGDNRCLEQGAVGPFA